MSNPAILLANLLAQWDVPAGQRSEDVRGFHTPPEVEFWKSQGRAVELLLDIERALAGLAEDGNDVTAFIETLPYWYRAVFSYTVPWQDTGSKSTRPIINPAHLNLLRGLGTLLGYAQSAPVLLPDALEEIRTALEETRDLIKTTPGLDRSVRSYMLSLVWEALRCLEEIDTFGTAHPRRVVFELSGIMYTYAEQVQDTEPEVAETFLQKARNVVARLFMASANKAIETGTTEFVTKMLE